MSLITLIDTTLRFSRFWIYVFLTILEAIRIILLSLITISKDRLHDLQKKIYRSNHLVTSQHIFRNSNKNPVKKYLYHNLGQ